MFSHICGLCVSLCWQPAVSVRSVHACSLMTLTAFRTPEQPSKDMSRPTESPYACIGRRLIAAHVAPSTQVCWMPGRDSRSMERVSTLVRGIIPRLTTRAISARASHLNCMSDQNHAIIAATVCCSLELNQGRDSIGSSATSATRVPRLVPLKTTAGHYFSIGTVGNWSPCIA